MTAASKSTAPEPADRLTRRQVWAQSWPIMAALASTPMVGVVDTAVIGRTGDTNALAAVALGATIIGFIFWAFGFLRMGATGLTAQAYGAKDISEVQSLLARSALVGFALGMMILVVSPLLDIGAFALLSAETAVETTAATYTQARFWGAPAALMVYGATGWLLGLGRSRETLILQLFTNAANAGFDVLFVWRFDMGAAGVGAGTALAEWLAAGLAAVICLRVVARQGGWASGALSWSAIAAPERLRRMAVVNSDIMVRTLALLLLFAWFTNSGARLGETQLAANHVLLQLLAISAFALDAFAFTAEARVGAAVGAGSIADLRRAIRLTSEFAITAGAGLSALMFLAGGPVIDYLIRAPDAAQIAKAYLPLAALVPLLGAPAWMLDGVFIGATRSRELRNSAILATGLYIALDLSLRGHGNLGVWLAMTASYGLRAAPLAFFYPRIERDLTEVGADGV
ncbi:MAG: MATE family efflux transporter [Pseudomonadota bacterium]